ncbi:hypothetical protein Scep_009137 [Stephania cephalantha]|uniref:SAGA-associated factor 11 n=1 Tax=Stephania cephalantha TaxID=152367 RepID=A0AAP0JT37_9MAGN
MVCAIGRGRRMAVMKRLLANGTYPNIAAEEANNERLAVRSIYKELREADEPNLLAEEDMHVFDCNPMTDPLHLVCCNTCRRPVKASQYAVHAERCRSLSPREETILEVDGGTGHKKPPRKGRKKLQASHGNHTTVVGEQERSGSMEGDDAVASELNAIDHIGTTFCCRNSKRNSASLDGTCGLDGSLVSPRSINYSAGVMSPSEKRAKLITAEHVLISEGLETACGITTDVGIHCQEALTYLPVPLATKVYHFQRNPRLRRALSHLYHEESAKQQQIDSLNSVPLGGSPVLPSQVTSPTNLLQESHANGFLQKKQKGDCTSAAGHKPDEILTRSSELCSGNKGSHSSATNFSTQLRDNHFSRPVHSIDTTSMGMMRNRFLPSTYSFPGNSGTSLGAMQKPNGSVPVV